MKTHTFYLTEAQRNNTANYLGMVASKLREERHKDNADPRFDKMYEDLVIGAEKLQAIFEFQSSTPKVNK